VWFAGAGKTASSSAATDVRTADRCSATKSSSLDVQVYDHQSCLPESLQLKSLTEEWLSQTMAVFISL